MGASAIGPAMKGVSSLAGGGKGGGGSGGGLSPQQAALAQYTMGQNILKNEGTFASEGTGLSTMKSFANAGAQMAGAMQGAGMADANAAAQQQVDQSSQGDLSQLAQGAGFGSTSGNFGSTGGTLSTNPTES